MCLAAIVGPSVLLASNVSALPVPSIFLIFADGAVPAFYISRGWINCSTTESRANKILVRAQLRQNLDFALRLFGCLRLDFIGVSSVKLCRLRRCVWAGGNRFLSMATPGKMAASKEPGTIISQVPSPIQTDRPTRLSGTGFAGARGRRLVCSFNRQFNLLPHSAGDALAGGGAMALVPHG